MDDLDDIAKRRPPRSLFQQSILDAAAMLRGPQENQYAKYQTDPVGYAREVLKVNPWSVQQEILKALHEPPYRVMVKSGNGPGKSWVASTAINQWYDCYDPSLVITTAPTDRDVRDVLWKTVRLQRQHAGLPDDFIGPSAPEMRTSPDHYAKGYTARKGESFKGRHDQRMLFVFDEAIGVDRSFWINTDTMVHPDGGHAWLVLFNPTDPTSIAYQQEHEVDADGNPKWRVFTLSCLDHPNVVERREVIPGAVSYAKVAQSVQEYCDPIYAEDALATDIQWEGKCYRPGPEFESNVLGRWPSQGSYSVWTDALWESAASAVTGPVLFPSDVLPEVGADLAGPGKDNTDYHSRWGPWSLRHESYNGWMLPRKLGRMYELLDELAEMVNRARQAADPGAPICSPKAIRVKIDDANVGGEMVAMMRERGYNAVSVHTQKTDGVNIARYPNMRSQLWFSTAKQAEMGLVRLGRLPRATLAMLKAQAMAPAWWLDAAGRRVVEEKEITMDKVGRSPDGMDSVNLAFLNLDWKVPEWIGVAKPAGHEATPLHREDHRQLLQDRIRSRGHRPLFGRR